MSHNTEKPVELFVRPIKKHTKPGDVVFEPVVGERFAYFGKDGPPLPSELSFLRTGRGHRCKFTEGQVRAVADWFERLPQGLRSRPARWPADDLSWKDP